MISVNVGRAVDAAWAGRLKRTAIHKRPAGDRVKVCALGLDGDEQADLENHGGPDKAVYAYAREELDRWAGLLDRELRDGVFGENLTTSGLDVTEARLGERWRIGGLLAEVTGPRIPCGVFRAWLAEPSWVKRFAQEGRPGAYLRVLEEGDVGAGDPIEIVYRPLIHPTIAEAMRAWYGDVGQLRRVLAVRGRASAWDAAAEKYLPDDRRP